MKNGQVTIKEFLEERIDALEDKVSLHLKLNQVALDKASAELNARLEHMNEFRQQLQRQEGTFLTKENYDVKHTLLEREIASLKETRAELRGRATQQSVYIAYLLALIGIVFTLYDLIKGV